MAAPSVAVAVVSVAVVPVPAVCAGRIAGATLGTGFRCGFRFTTTGASGALRASHQFHGSLRVLAAGRSGGGHEPHRLSAPPAEAVAAVLDAARRGGGLVVADLGRRLDVTAGPAAHACDHLVLVVAAEIRSVAAAATIAPALHRVCRDVRLVVRAGARGRLRPRDVAQTLGLPCAATIESDPAIATAADRGELARALGRGSCSTIARVLADVLDPRQAA